MCWEKGRFCGGGRRVWVMVKRILESHLGKVVRGVGVGRRSGLLGVRAEIGECVHCIGLLIERWGIQSEGAWGLGVVALLLD